MLRHAIEGLRSDVEALAANRRLNAAEALQLAGLLPALAGVVGEKVFFAADVLALPPLAPLVAGHTAGSLARLFVRARGISFGALRISRVGRDSAGALFSMTMTKSAPDRHNAL